MTQAIKLDNRSNNYKDQHTKPRLPLENPTKIFVNGKQKAVSYLEKFLTQIFKV